MKLLFAAPFIAALITASGCKEAQITEVTEPIQNISEVQESKEEVSMKIKVGDK